MPAPKGWITAADAREVLGVSASRVHQIVAEYDVDTMLVNARFKLFKEEDIRKIAKMPRPNGVKAAYR